MVDGDTIDVRRDGEEWRVRLLNVDAPESTDPDAPPECLGPEATAFLEELLPVGTAVRLEQDEETQDQYGRELAGVFLDETLVNAEIAREGLGVAVLYEPNDRFYADVLAAQEEAREAGHGLYDEAIGCTLPAHVAQFAQSAAAVTAAAPPSDASLAALESHAEELALTAASGAAVLHLLDGDGSAFPLVAFAAGRLNGMRETVGSAAREVDRAIEENAAAIDAEEDRLAAEEAERRAAEEAERRAAEEEAARQAAEEEAAEQAARDEARREAARQAETQVEARRAEQQRSSGSRSSSGSGSGSGPSGSGSGGYDGYTGCRAYGGGYAPNATDEQGRPYTKIDCSSKAPIG
ncbi:thermonuclease family protein [Georgenia sp. 10Sc9-8]|uniref:Thermonuclease family protein n=1 Tax=Georgenia halotolerans TaxID=3028317 RepID=A0ABT5TZ60_9MICO|nr:thermonuclease family protein [Georgenia halotolerans]